MCCFSRFPLLKRWVDPGRSGQGFQARADTFESVGLVVSWTIGTRPDANFVNTMLDAATETVVTSKNKPVIHSDRGAHYRWPGWLSRVQNARLIRSMSRKGCSPDNAACEGFLRAVENRVVLSSELAGHHDRPIRPDC